MSIIITEEKAALRRQIRAVLAGLSEEARAVSDAKLFARFLALPEVAEARALLLFCGTGTEPDTGRLLLPLLESGKTVALPRCLPGCRMEARAVTAGQLLRPGAYGIPEPGEDCPVLDPGEIDLILVPALCYDRRRFRLGQGGGYYDRYLANYRGRTVGLCRDLVLQDALPREATDLPVGLVLTESMFFS